MNFEVVKSKCCTNVIITNLGHWNMAKHMFAIAIYGSGIICQILQENFPECKEWHLCV